LSSLPAVEVPASNDYLETLAPNQKQVIDEWAPILQVLGINCDFRNATLVLFKLQEAFASPEWTGIIQQYYFYKYNVSRTGRLTEDEARSLAGDFLVSLFCKGDVSDVVNLTIDGMANFEALLKKQK